MKKEPKLKSPEKCLTKEETSNTWVRSIRSGNDRLDELIKKALKKGSHKKDS